ncbi:hypothetical protein JOD55_001202 [Arcanobacterium pluranimalium]|uniref:FKBP-type peptidyl-prolyl cis-trans isomerase n=1 Tax=Arcanobacterium pluranimalium TaxID=108028 RepID=UPI00195E288E|nr:FKBP-type peptidyl-prolyl cis-trans isomerase [Arcanobacterium pluranimalium]MBM7825375.1 hypothetical protein [Arcanobacterium pluranimalium]
MLRRSHFIIGFVVALIVGMGVGMIHTTHSKSDTALTIVSHGEVGSPASISVTGSIHARDKGYKELVKGNGRVVADGTQLLYQASSYSYDSNGKLVNNNRDQFYAGKADKKGLGSISDAVVGKTEGSRIAVVNPDSSLTSAEIVVIDILSTTIQGQMKPYSGTVPFPGITAGENNKPALGAIGQPVASLSVSELIAGKGAQITQHDAIFANYVLVDANGTVVEDTWNNPQPAYIEISKVFSGMRAGLVDQRIGSRVALAIPAQEAQGNHDLYAVVDILAIANKAED